MLREKSALSRNYSLLRTEVTELDTFKRHVDYISNRQTPPRYANRSKLVTANHRASRR